MGKEDFFPTDYEVPNESPYMKFEDGKNKFRILKGFGNDPDSAIMGTEYWVTTENNKRKPKRLRVGETVPVGELEENPKTGELERPKHFWAMPVYNYATKSVQILEITQKRIMFTINGLSEDEDWGTPINYDLTVNRSDDNGMTSYSVVPSPKKPLEEGIYEMFSTMKLNLKALYQGGDPFLPIEEVSQDQLVDVDKIGDIL